MAMAHCASAMPRFYTAKTHSCLAKRADEEQVELTSQVVEE
jgi:hypothetical protein